MRDIRAMEIDWAEDDKPGERTEYDLAHMERVARKIEEYAVHRVDRAKHGRKNGRPIMFRKKQYPSKTIAAKELSASLGITELAAWHRIGREAA